MAVKLRLARHGRTRRPYYYILAADSRSPRDGKYIDRIGSYNPMTNPATIDLDFDKALTWLMNGAQPTMTVKRILSYKGVLMKKHLLEGVRKGAFDEAEAERRFNDWLQQKETKISSKVSSLEEAKTKQEKERIAAETAIKEARAQAIAKRFADQAKAAEDAAAEARAAEEPAEEVVAEAPATEAPVAETPAEEVAVAEAPAEETPAAEEVATETPAEPAE